MMNANARSKRRTDLTLTLLSVLSAGASISAIVFVPPLWVTEVLTVSSIIVLLILLVLRRSNPTLSSLIPSSLLIAVAGFALLAGMYQSKSKEVKAERQEAKAIQQADDLQKEMISVSDSLHSALNDRDDEALAGIVKAETEWPGDRSVNIQSHYTSDAVYLAFSIDNTYRVARQGWAEISEYYTGLEPEIDQRLKYKGSAAGNHFVYKHDIHPDIKIEGQYAVVTATTSAHDPSKKASDQLGTWSDGSDKAKPSKVRNLSVWLLKRTSAISVPGSQEAGWVIVEVRGGLTNGEIDTQKRQILEPHHFANRRQVDAWSPI